MATKTTLDRGTEIEQLERERKYLLRYMNFYADGSKKLIEQIRKWSERVNEIDRRIGEITDRSIARGKEENI
jgi:hypothetical protein